MPEESADLSSSARGFESALGLFLAGMEAVEELAAFAHEHARPLDDEDRIIQAVLASRVTATPEQHRVGIATVQKMVQDIAEATESAKAGADGRADEAPDSFKAAIDPVIDEAFTAIREISADPNAFGHYVHAFTQTRTRVARLSVLNASLLTTAVSNFEVLVSGLVKEFLRERPQALRSDDTKYSLAEISAFETLDEFRDFSGDRYVESILRGSFDDWMTWFERQLKVKPELVTQDLSVLREVFQRRHLFVHNGGRVNRLYLSKLPDLANPPAIGFELVVDSDYLSATVDALTSAGTLLAAMTMRKLIPTRDNEHPADQLVNDVAYQFLRMGRWRVVISLTSAMADDCASEYTRYVMRINGWIARKRSEGTEAIRAEVEAWEVSALAPRLKLARLALLNRTKEAHSRARTLLERGEMTQEDWRNWPLLDEVREYHRELDSNETPVEATPPVCGAALESEGVPQGHTEGSHEVENEARGAVTRS